MEYKIEYTINSEERAKRLRKSGSTRLFEFTRALANKFGPEVYAVLGETNKKLAIRSTQNVLKELNIEERDAISAVRVLSYLHAFSGTSGEVVEATPTRAVRIERSCPASECWDYEYCYKVGSLPVAEGICAAINPKLTVSHPKYITRGDDCCEFVFELKE